MTIERFNEINNEIDKIRACDRITEQEASELEMMVFAGREEFEEFSDICNGEDNAVLYDPKQIADLDEMDKLNKRYCNDCGHWVNRESEWESDIDACIYCADNDEQYQGYLKSRDKEGYMMDAAHDRYNDSL